MGKDIVGANDEKIGEVDDVIVDGSGNPKAVLVDVGGFLGIGGKSVAIPIDEIQPQEDRIMVSGLTKDSAKAMPEYKEEAGERRGSAIYKTQVENVQPLPPTTGSGSTTTTPPATGATR
jgi:sporulation protein YlmC with PRC-barrel domain